MPHSSRSPRRPLSATLRALPPGIWALGFGSMLMDTSSEMIHSLLPVFMVSVLHSSMSTIGLIEGVAEATASIAKVFSGVLSDHWRQRKPLLVFGYALAALTKPMFALAPSIGWVFAARFADRLGKGIRGAPRDALVADLAAPKLRGAAYGLRQALDSVGAFLGPLLATVFLFVFASNLRAVMGLAVIPAVITVLLLLRYVREPEHARAHTVDGRPLLRRAVQLPARYWTVVALGAVFTLARFSEAFLVLRGQQLGLAIAYVPLVMIAMNLPYALLAYPAGAAADHLRARHLLIGGLLLLVAADAVLARAATPAAVFAGAGLWGLHMALTQGLFAKLVADTASAPLRGTAFGIYNLVSGVALLGASALAGALWEYQGPALTFWVGGGFASVALLGLLVYRPRRRQR